MCNCGGNNLLLSSYTGDGENYVGLSGCGCQGSNYTGEDHFLGLFKKKKSASIQDRKAEMDLENQRPENQLKLAQAKLIASMAQPTQVAAPLAAPAAKTAPAPNGGKNKNQVWLIAGGGFALLVLGVVLVLVLKK